MKTNPDNCAFSHGTVAQGLTKREYFAALALQGMVSQGDYDEYPVVMLA